MALSLFQCGIRQSATTGILHRASYGKKYYRFRAPRSLRVSLLLRIGCSIRSIPLQVHARDLAAGACRGTYGRKFVKHGMAHRSECGLIGECSKTLVLVLHPNSSSAALPFTGSHLPISELHSTSRLIPLVCLNPSLTPNHTFNAKGHNISIIGIV